MLVLTVTKAKTVVIHKNGQVIAILRVPNSFSLNKLRIGIEATPDITIDREGVYIEKYGVAPTLS